MAIYRTFEKHYRFRSRDERILLIAGNLNEVEFIPPPYPVDTLVILIGKFLDSKLYYMI